MLRNAHLFIILFVRNFRRACSQFWLSVRNSLWSFFLEIQEEIHHFAGWEGGGVKGRESCEQTSCEQTGENHRGQNYYKKTSLQN